MFNSMYKIPIDHKGKTTCDHHLEFLLHFVEKKKNNSFTTSFAGKNGVCEKDVCSKHQIKKHGKKSFLIWRKEEHLHFPIQRSKY